MTPRTLRTIRIGLWAAVFVVAAAATLAYFLIDIPEPGGAFGKGDYVLEDSTGAAITEASFKGAPAMLFFGYTNCPDVCPTTLSEMQVWFKELGDAGKDLRAFFITVDPARDTPEVIGDYVGWLDGRVTAVTGTQAEIDKVVKAWGITATKVGEGDKYTMNHTASVYLINADGEFESTIAYGEDMDAALAKLRRLVGA